MKSVLIRFTDSKYANDYLAGNLSLSPLSTFWNLKYGRIDYADIVAGRVTFEDYERTKRFLEMHQDDIQEGVCAQIPCNKLPKEFLDVLGGHILHDVRFRMEAYGYCKLLCFFRVDYEEMVNKWEKRKIVQLPDSLMDNYGDMVILIKDEEEFTRRIIEAVKRQGGECVIGDVHYQLLKDRAYKRTVGSRHHVSMISGGDGVNGDTTDGLFPISDFLNEKVDAIHYGCLDKYVIYKQQKEWRVCWLPTEYNHIRKILEVGNLEDIIVLIPTKDIRKKLLKLHPGYVSGVVDTERRDVNGTLEYNQFMNKVESIDGLCRIIMELG